MSQKRMSETKRKHRFFQSAVGVVAGVLALTSCSSDSTTTSTTSATSSAGGASSSVSPAAQTALDAAYEGVSSDLTALTPVTPQASINLYVVSCGEQVPGCSVPAAAVKEAAEAVGWTVTIADGKLNPEGFATAIRQGVAGGANVIVPIGIGCGVAQAAFQEAVTAGIKIIGGGGVDDCSPKLWAAERLWLEGFTPQQQWEEFGKLQADYAFGKSNGDVKAVVLSFTTQVWGPWISGGFEAELETLGGGEVLTTIQVSDPEIADGSYIQKVTTALLANPDANTLVVPVDGWLTNGLSQAIVSAQLDDKLLVIGRGGDAAALDLIRQGGAGLDATIGTAVQWGGWGSIDTAARVLAGEKGVYIGESMQAIDQENNMPASGQYTGNIDYQAAFKAAWGV